LNIIQKKAKGIIG